MCLDTACLLVWNSSATAFGVMAWAAINNKIALRVGSAMAQKTSRLASIYVQLSGCKYKCNYLVAQSIYSDFFKESCP
jgi:hypothetical protein